MEVFWSKGYEGASLTDLTAAMGINSPSLYGAFGSKEALFREAVELYRQTDGGARQALQNAPSARDAMQGMLLAAAERFTTPGLPPGCMIVLGAGGTVSPPGIGEFLCEGRREMQARILARLNQGAAGGELPDDADLKGLAAFYTTVLHGMSIQARDGASRRRCRPWRGRPCAPGTHWPASRLRTTPLLKNGAMIRIDLRRLILWISLLSIMLVLAGGLHASYLVQRDLLLHNAQEDNRAYASKLAATTEYFLNDLRRYLAFSAEMLADMQAHPELMAEETRRQETQLGHFNSSFIVSPQGKVLSASASVPDLLGRQMHSTAAQDAIQTQRPTISEPFQGRSGRWLILYTHPIFSADKRYIGYIAGTLYLHQDNVLDRLLGQHFHRDDSVLRVMDRNGTLIYDRDRSMLGKPAAELQALAPAARRDGELRFVDAHGRDMLAGYAPVPSTGWSLIAQRPVAGTLQPLSDLLLATARNTLPLLLLSIASLWLLSRLIAKPLGELAGFAKRMQDLDSADGIRGVRSWYFEATQLKRALLMGLASMHHKMRDLRRKSATDTLTGLLNRRGLEEAMAMLQAEDTPVAIVVIDIDHFKNINDRYGHAAGDRALQRLAKQMADSARASDTLRAGGEEFVMLLPGVPMAAAVAAAHRLRLKIATSPNPDLSAHPITLSAGVAHYPTHGATLEAVYQRADQALYYAKNHGRNAVAAADDLVRGGMRNPCPEDGLPPPLLALAGRRRAFACLSSAPQELPSSALGPIKASRPAAGVSTRPAPPCRRRAPAATFTPTSGLPNVPCTYSGDRREKRRKPLLSGVISRFSFSFLKSAVPVMPISAFSVSNTNTRGVIVPLFICRSATPQLIFTSSSPNSLETT